MTKVSISNKVAGITTILTTLVEICLRNLIDECTMIPSARKVWMSSMARRTQTEGLGLIVVRRTNVSVTLQNGSRDKALSPRPSKEERNSRKASECHIHDPLLRPHHITCSSRIMYQSHTMLLAVPLADNLSCFAFICCSDFMSIIEHLSPLNVKLVMIGLPYEYNLKIRNTHRHQQPGGQNLASQLTPQPQPFPLACGLSVMRKLEPMSSVAKSTVDPFKRSIDTTSMRTLEGATNG